MRQALMKVRLSALRRELGPLGMAAIAVMALAMAFSTLVVQPLEKHNRSLVSSLKKTAAAPAASGDKVAAVYGFLAGGGETTDSLAKLHGIGKATGVELKSASYRTQRDAGRIERYEIVLPAAGSYAQIRDFLKRALAEMPALSLDHIALRRQSRNDGTVSAELRLSLHRVKP